MGPRKPAETHIAPACLTHAEGGTGESELAMSSVGRARSICGFFDEFLK
jgi:hypothetical protein